MKRGGFARAALLLVDISKVKLLKGNSTSKTNRKWALGWLTDGSGVCVCVPGVCTSSENHFFHKKGERETERDNWRDTCVSILVSLAKSSHCFLCFVNKNCVRLSRFRPLTFSDLAAPYLALILGSLMVARLVPVMVNMVPPLKKKKKR